MQEKVAYHIRTITKVRLALNVRHQIGPCKFWLPNHTLHYWKQRAKTIAGTDRNGNVWNFNILPFPPRSTIIRVTIGKTSYVVEGLTQTVKLSRQKEEGREGGGWPTRDNLQDHNSLVLLQHIEEQKYFTNSEDSFFCSNQYPSPYASRIVFRGRRSDWVVPHLMWAATEKGGGGEEGGMVRGFDKFGSPMKSLKWIKLTVTDTVQPVNKTSIYKTNLAITQGSSKTKPAIRRFLYDKRLFYKQFVLYSLYEIQNWYWPTTHLLDEEILWVGFAYIPIIIWIHPLFSSLPWAS